MEKEVTIQCQDVVIDILTRGHKYFVLKADINGMGYPDNRKERNENVTWVDTYCEITEDGRVSRECAEQHWNKSTLAKYPLKDNYRQPSPFTGHAVCDNDDKDRCDAHYDKWHPNINPSRHFTEDFIYSYFPKNSEDDVKYIN